MIEQLYIYIYICIIIILKSDTQVQVYILSWLWCLTVLLKFVEFVQYHMYVRILRSCGDAYF